MNNTIVQAIKISIKEGSINELKSLEPLFKRANFLHLFVNDICSRAAEDLKYLQSFGKEPFFDTESFIYEKYNNTLGSLYWYIGILKGISLDTYDLSFKSTIDLKNTDTYSSNSAINFLLGCLSERYLKLDALNALWYIMYSNCTNSLKVNQIFNRMNKILLKLEKGCSVGSIK